MVCDGQIVILDKTHSFYNNRKVRILTETKAATRRACVSMMCYLILLTGLSLAFNGKWLSIIMRMCIMHQMYSSYLYKNSHISRAWSPFAKTSKIDQVSFVFFSSLRLLTRKHCLNSRHHYILLRVVGSDSYVRCLMSKWDWLLNVTCNDISVIYIWQHIDVQTDWRSLTHGRAPISIAISYGSLTCPSKHRQGANIFIRLFRDTAPFSCLLGHAWDTEDTFSTLTLPGPHWGRCLIKETFPARYKTPPYFKLSWTRDAQGGCERTGHSPNRRIT